MKKVWLTFRHHVFVDPEARQTLGDKQSQPFLGGLALDRQPHLRGPPRVLCEYAFDQSDHFTRDRVRFLAEGRFGARRPGAFPSIIGRAIFNIEIPGVSFWLAVSLHQPSKAFPHATIMILHHQAFLRPSPGTEIRARQKKLRGRNKLDLGAQFATKFADCVGLKERVWLGEHDLAG
jgi:hypothetical protein